MRSRHRRAGFVASLAASVALAGVAATGDVRAQTVYRTHGASDGTGARASRTPLIDCKGASPLDCGTSLRGDKGKGGGGGNGGGGNGGGNGAGSSGGGSSAGGSGNTSTGGGTRPQATGGTINPFAQFNPICDDATLRGSQRANCRATGTPEGRYPASNYAFDINIDTGLDNIDGNFLAFLAQVGNMMWQACLFVLSLVLTLVGWALELAPFTEGGFMREVGDALSRFYRAFTNPLLVMAMAMIGVWLTWRGLVKREGAAAIGQAALALALMLVAAVIIFNPRGTVGLLARWVEKGTYAVLSAPNGAPSSGAGGYAEATGALWNGITFAGFSGLNFSNVEWAFSRPDPKVLEVSDRYACMDVAYLARLSKEEFAQQYGRIAAAAATDGDCREIEGVVVPRPRTNLEVWLRSSPGSKAREVLWEELDGDSGDDNEEGVNYDAYLSMQGEGGAIMRLALTSLYALGLLGAILLLAFLAIRIFTQTVMAFVLLCAAPIMLLLPAVGERGMAAFRAWGWGLVGAVLSKLVYAALLAVVILGANLIAKAPSVVGALDVGSIAVNTAGPSKFSPVMAFLLQAGFFWAAFLKRGQVIGILSSAGDDDDDGRLLRRAGTLYRAGKAASAASEALGRRRDEADAEGAGGDEDLDRATDRVAEQEREESVEQMAEARYADNQAAITVQEGRESRVAELLNQNEEANERLSELRQARDEAELTGNEEGAHELQEDIVRLQGQIDERREEVGRLEGEIRDDTEPVAAAREFNREADQARAAPGEGRFSEAQLSDMRGDWRRDLDRPPTDEAHAWRAGMGHQEYRELMDSDRPEDARRRQEKLVEVKESLHKDRLVNNAVSDRPGGLVGAPEARKRFRRAYLEEHGKEGHGKLRLERTRARDRRQVEEHRERMADLRRRRGRSRR